jgi:hypothetical protein
MTTAREQWTSERHSISQRMLTSSEHAWDPMASSSVSFRQKNTHRACNVNYRHELVASVQDCNRSLQRGHHYYTLQSGVERILQHSKIAWLCNTGHGYGRCVIEYLQCLDGIYRGEPVRGVNSREECHWLHACKSFKRAGVAWDPMASSSVNFCRKTRTIHRRTLRRNRTSRCVRSPCPSFNGVHDSHEISKGVKRHLKSMSQMAGLSPQQHPNHELCRRMGSPEHHTLPAGHCVGRR